MHPTAQPATTPSAPRKPTRGAAIHAKCKDCCYDPLDAGNWRQQTGACQVTACPLWPYRPVSKPRKATEPAL